MFNVSQIQNNGIIGNDSDSGDDVVPNSSFWPFIAGLFAFLALFMSIWEITQHLINYNKPYLQKYVVRILWMVPIYAMNSVNHLFKFF
jgi:hypothetical protein